MHGFHTGDSDCEPAARDYGHSSTCDMQRTVRNTDSQRSAELYLDTFSEPERFDRLTGYSKSFFNHHLHGDGNR